VNALPPLPEEAIDLHVRAVDWRDAVRLVGRGLARSGATRQAYADEMIRMIEENGPYVVIAPGLALAHARPGPDVLRTGLAIATLAEPVAFGHPHNDPVRVVVGLAVATPREHLGAVAAVANVFNDSGAIDELVAATDVAAVQALFH
jgi:ascorbate PTS system EIIA or EIIAB component